MHRSTTRSAGARRAGKRPSRHWVTCPSRLSAMGSHPCAWRVPRTRGDDSLGRLWVSKPGRRGPLVFCRLSWCGSVSCPVWRPSHPFSATADVRSVETFGEFSRSVLRKPRFGFMNGLLGAPSGTTREDAASHVAGFRGSSECSVVIADAPPSHQSPGSELSELPWPPIEQRASCGNPYVRSDGVLTGCGHMH